MFIVCHYKAKNMLSYEVNQKNMCNSGQALFPYVFFFLKETHLTQFLFYFHQHIWTEFAENLQKEMPSNVHYHPLPFSKY